MIVETRLGSVRVAVLIPSKSRADVLLRTLTKADWLNDPLTYVGIEHGEVDMYCSVWRSFPQLTVVNFDNPTRSIGVAREHLRRVATEATFDYVVLTDDNASYTYESFTNLVRCAHEWPTDSASGTVAHGFHTMQSKFYQRGEEGYRTDERTVNGLTSYEGLCHIFWCLPRTLYRQYRHPADCFTYDDGHVALWLLSQPDIPAMRVCVNAVYDKTRHQPGGHAFSDPNEKLKRIGMSFGRLCQDFPLLMGATGGFPISWKFVFAIARGYRYATHVPHGGRMRHEDILEKMEKWTV